MKNARILIATKSPFAADAVEAAVRAIQDAGYEPAVLEKYPGKQDLLAAVADVHALIVRSDAVDQEVIDAAPNLSLVIRGGAGYNNIDVAACTKRGITVMNTPGQNANAVAELALGSMLAGVRFIVKADVTTKQGEFLKSKLTGTELLGKKFGIHGFGYIGQLLAVKARGCGMRVFAYDPWVSTETAYDKGVTLVKTLEELYLDADFVSLHIPKSKNTEKSITLALLSLMKHDGMLINTARAEVVNHADLEKVLDERPKFRYAADVHPEGDEPGPKALARFGDRVILTPHIGASTREANFNTATAAATQAVEFFRDGKMTAAVNKEVVPYWMRQYADLAQMLGLLCSKLVKGQPREVQVICYADLEKFRDAFAHNVLKGVYLDYDREMTPVQAGELAQQNGVLVRKDIEPDNTRGHGNSITVDYMVKADGALSQASVRGTVADSMLKVSRIKEFLNVDFQPAGLVTVFEYTEKEGMVDIIGEYFTKAGYNKKQGRFVQSPAGDKAISLFQVEKKGIGGEPTPEQEAEVRAICERVAARVPEIYNAIAVRFG